MVWQEIRTHYPEQWLLVEAIKAHTLDNKRILDQLAVVNAFPEGIPLGERAEVRDDEVARSRADGDGEEHAGNVGHPLFHANAAPRAI
jgi:hypothetical protein